MFKSRILLLLVIASALAITVTRSADAQSPRVIDAVDNDPENHLWNCDTNRVPFDNQETDRSRCFTFRYTVPPEGISSATVHIALDTLGSLQDTDATIVAVSAPVEACAWGQGTMPGCVVLHGGFKGGEKSLNLDLLNIACDASIPNSADNQQLVRKALESGVLHLELQDDTAVYNAQLVLNGGPLSSACGTSEETAAAAVATQAASSASSAAPKSALDNVFDPPQYLLHATGHGTINGPVKDDWYLLYPRAPDSRGFFEIADGTGGTFTYSTDYSSGPYKTPREVCAAAGSRVGDTQLAPWNGGDSFSCKGVVAPAIGAAPAGLLSAFDKGATEFLTGTPTPRAPDLDGAATASVAGALALAVLAASNYLLGSNSFVQSAMKNALRQPAPGSREMMAQDAGTREAGRGATDDSLREGSKARTQARDASAGRAEAQTRDTSTGRPEAGTQARDASATRAAMGAQARDASASPTGAGIGSPEATSTNLGTSAAQERGLSGSTGGTMHQGGTVLGGTPSTLPGVQGSAGVNLPTGTPSTDVGAMALDKSVQEGMSSVPDASDLLKDKLVDKAEAREKMRRLQAEVKRLQELVAMQTQTFTASSDALKRAVDGVGDYDTAHRAWRLAEHELSGTRAQLEKVLKQLAALEPRQEE